MDLSAKIVENKGQAAGETSENVTPGTVDVDILETQSEEEIFLSEEEEEDEELCSQTLILTEESDNVEELEANVKLREENVRLKENILAERRLNQKYQEKLLREKSILEARQEFIQHLKIEDLDGSLQRLKSFLDEKDWELKKNVKTIEELNKLVQQERNNSSVLRNLLVEEITVKSSLETDGADEFNSGCVVSEKELQQVAAKLEMLHEISARLESSQTKSEKRIMELELSVKAARFQNIQLRKQVAKFQSQQREKIIDYIRILQQ